MRSLNPEWVKTVVERVSACPYFSLLSMKIIDLQPGKSHLEIEAQPKHLQPFGMIHGGVFSSLIDASGFWAAYTELEEGHGMTTVEMKLNYLAPAAQGRLIGWGQSIKVGRTLSLAEAKIENQDGRLLAHGTVTLMTLTDLHLENQDNLPSKFT